MMYLFQELKPAGLDTTFSLSKQINHTFKCGKFFHFYHTTICLTEACSQVSEKVTRISSFYSEFK